MKDKETFKQQLAIEKEDSIDEIQVGTQSRLETVAVRIEKNQFKTKKEVAIIFISLLYSSSDNIYKWEITKAFI